MDKVEKKILTELKGCMGKVARFLYNNSDMRNIGNDVFVEIFRNKNLNGMIYTMETITRCRRKLQNSLNFCPRTKKPTEWGGLIKKVRFEDGSQTQLNI